VKSKAQGQIFKGAAFKKTAFGKYELVDKIGTGGMAEIFLARSYGAEGLHKTLVIKRILSEFSQNERFIEMFIAEAKIAVQLNHPNIVQIYDFGKVDEDFYLAMEYVDGLDLAQVLEACAKARRPLSIGEAIYVAAEVAKGLHYAHNRLGEYGEPLAIVHRDISPQNILISADGTVKIVDFGIAKASSVADDRPNVVKGKFGYMSPEQAGGAPIDERSDLFSLGTVLFELVCGRPLFRAAGRDETLSLVKSAVVPDIRALNPAVPEQLERLLYKVLALDPAERHGSAREFQVELTRVLYGLGEIHDAMTLSGHIEQVRARIPDGILRQSAQGSERRTAVTDVINAALPVNRTLAPGSALAAQSTPIDDIMVNQTRRQGPAVTRERKEIVVVAGEVVGLPELRAGGSDSSRRAQVLQEYTRIVDSIAFKNEGLVHRVDEDDFAIVLGVPVSSENDAERAVRMAMDLHEAIAGMSFSLDSPLQLAIGASVAEAFVERSTEQPAEFQWSFYADSQELAVGLAQSAMAREILLGGQVYRRVRRKYNCESLDEVRFARRSGGEHALQPHRLVGRKSQRAQLDELRTSYRSFHGREIGLGVLRNAYRQSLLRGRSLGVLITGEQGIGKSTLVEEFLAGLAPRDVRVVRGVVTPFERDVPLGAMANLLTEIMRLGPVDDLRQLRETLRTRVEALFGGDDATERELLLHSLGAIFNVRYPGGAFRDLDGEERRMRKYLSLTRLLLRFAEQKPVVLAIEDVQNLDESTLEFAAQFLDSRHDAPAFFIATANLSQVDQDSAVWKAFRGARYLVAEEIGELAAAEARALIKSLLGLHGVFDERLVDEILRRSGGNPLFIKEVVEALSDRGLINDSEAISRLQASDENPQWLPASVEGLIGARIDRLKLANKAVLQRVSLLGTPFSVSQAELVLERGSVDALDALDELVGLELLERADAPPRAASKTYDAYAPDATAAPVATAAPDATAAPEATAPEERLYRFCNALTREVASRSLIPEQARALHLRIAQHLLEQRGAEPDGVHAGADNAVIAGHFDGAGEVERAVEFYALAAEEAFRNRGASECLRLCAKIIKRAASGEAGGDERVMLKALMLQERALSELGQVEDRRRALDELHRLVMRVGDGSEQIDVLLRQGRFFFDEGDFSRAREHIEQARRLVGQAYGDEARRETALADTFQVEILILMSEGKREQARELVRRAIDIYRRNDGIEALAGLAVCHNMLGVILRQAGHQGEALQAYEKALKFAEEGDIGKQMRLLLINTGVALAHAGEFSEAIGRYERALEQCRRLGHRHDEASVLVNLGHAYLLAGRRDEAIATIRRGIHLGRKTAANGVIADGQISLGACFLEGGELAAAEQAIHDGLRIADSIPDVYLSIHATLALAAVRLVEHAGEGSAAAEREENARIALMQAEDALERSQAADMKWGAAAAQSLMARALDILGDRAGSREKSSAAVALLETGGTTYGTDTIFYHHVKLLDGVDERREERLAILERARDYVVSRRNRLPDEASRALFMSRDINRKIMNAAAELLEFDSV
jgi:serine/threonine protein kinase/predicted ATPase